MILNEFDESWHDFLSKSGLLTKLETIVPNVELLYEHLLVYPVRNQVFRAFKATKLTNLSVVLLGQDPFPGEYNGSPSACGLSFVTENGYINPSLKIILKELKRTDFNTTTPAQMTKWTKEGVLLLNSALTVERSKPGSHTKIWKSFTNNLLTSLSKHNPNIIYVLLGKDAQSFKENIISGHIIDLPHPMVDIYSGKNVFVGSNIFNTINNTLTKLKKPTINF